MDKIVLMCWFCFSPFLHTLPAFRPAQLPDSTGSTHFATFLACSPAVLVSSAATPSRGLPGRRDFPSQPSSWPTAWLSPEPHRLLFLLVASMALPGRRPRGRLLKLASPNSEPRGEDACTEKSSPESVSTGNSTKPTLGFWRPQPFPLALILIDPAHPGWPGY